ncbi:MAG: hypothetical protein J7576_04855 [Siphonobacter aquaeclarae]|nr:hypothetical protein [Siphonobacter aquaeclarae]
MMKYCCFGVMLLLGLLTGCRKEFPVLEDPDNRIVGSFSAEFETFWQGMNNQYVFWDRDPTDWDAVYREYKPKFAELNLYREEDHEKAYYYYRDMTANLIDAHFTLSTQVVPAGEPTSLSPASQRNLRRADWHPPLPESFFYDTIFQQYLGDDSYRSKDASGNPSLVAGYARDRAVLYLRLPRFNLRETALTGTDDERLVWQYFVDAIKNPQADGLILDLRGNGGGYLEDLSFLLGQLITKPYVFGATRYKSGPGRLDYTAWIPAQVFPQQGSQAFTKPVVVLVDQYSASMSELTAVAVKAFPGGLGRVVGETTWGATGPVGSRTMFNSGPFFTAASYVYMASHQFRDTRQLSYEGKGIGPDAAVPQDGNALARNVDVQLEKAIQLFQ